jgi:hypothetical protein
MKKCNSELIEVTQVYIFEEGYEQNINKQLTVFDPPLTSGTIEYTSVSTQLQAGVDLDDQVDNIIPIGIAVYLLGNDQNGDPIPLASAPYASITYTNVCGSGPIVFDDSGLGNVRFVSTISIYFCINNTLSTGIVHTCTCSSLLSRHIHEHDMFDQI